MRKYIIIITLLYLSPSVIASAPEKYAYWSDINGIEKRFHDSFENARNQQHIPRLNEINIPPYPGSDLLKLDEFMCMSQLSSLLLVSHKPVDEVVTWYGKNLSGFFKSVTDERTFFVYGLADFDYSKDSIKLKDREYISIRKIGEAINKLAPKYETVIEIHFYTNKINYCKK